MHTYVKNDLYKTIDRAAVVATIHQLVGEIKELKGFQREAHQPRFGLNEDRRLRSAKRRATVLCSIRAAMRGRLHCAETLDKQQEMIRTAIGEFQQQQNAA